MPTNPLKDLPGYALRRASAWSMGGLAERLANIDLTPTEASLLVVVSANPGVIQSEIGRMLGIASANMAPLVGRLEQREYLERLPVDGRSFGLKLSRQGIEAANVARRAMAEQERHLIKQVPAELRPAFKDALQAILAGIED